MISDQELAAIPRWQRRLLAALLLPFVLMLDVLSAFSMMARLLRAAVGVAMRGSIALARACIADDIESAKRWWR